MTLTPELINALETVAHLRHPSIAWMLRQQRYEYEARVIERLIEAWEHSKHVRAVERNN